MFTIITKEEQLLGEMKAKKAELNKIKEIAKELRSIDEEIEIAASNPDQLIDDL